MNERQMERDNIFNETKQMILPFAKGLFTVYGFFVISVILLVCAALTYTFVFLKFKKFLFRF